MKWKLFITLPWVAWYLKTEEAENILSEWNKMMKISILCKSFSSGGKKIKPSLTSSENICPPTSFSFKGPIDLTYTVVFNSFDLLGSPPVHPVFSTQTEAELKSSAKESRRVGGRSINHANSSFSAKEWWGLGPQSWKVDVISGVCFADFQCYLERAEGRGYRVHVGTPPGEQEEDQPYKLCPVDLIWKSSYHSVCEELRECEMVHSDPSTCRIPAPRAFITISDPFSVTGGSINTWYRHPDQPDGWIPNGKTICRSNWMSSWQGIVGSELNPFTSLSFLITEHTSPFKVVSSQAVHPSSTALSWPEGETSG